MNRILGVDRAIIVGVCFFVGAASAGAASAFAWSSVALAKIQRGLRQERERAEVAAEEWKAETLRDLYQTVADQQARGVLDFYPDEAPRHIRAVHPLKESQSGRG